MTLILKGSHLAEEQNVRGLSHLTGQLAALRRSWLRVLSGRAAAPWKRDLPFSLHGWTRRYVTESRAWLFTAHTGRYFVIAVYRRFNRRLTIMKQAFLRDEPLAVMP